MTPSELELAQRALELVEPGDGAQATATRERSLLLRFARSRPTQSTAVDDLSVEVTVLRDGHAGRAVTNGTDADALRGSGRSALAAAEAAARTSGRGVYPGFPVPAPAPPAAHEGYDRETAVLDPARGGEALSDAFDAVERAGVEAHGIWTAAEVTTAIASSSGLAVSDAVTDAFMKVVAIAPGGRTGYAATTAAAASDLDARSLASTAASKAAATGEVARLPPGEYPVVMEPHAVGVLLDELGRVAFNGQMHAEGRGALVGQLGKRLAAPAVNLSDSPRYPRTLPRAFDAEGVPKAPLPLIQDGVAQGVVHDVRSAALAGTATTGHALEPGGSPEGPHPTNLVLIGGGAENLAELCRPIERGVYVTRLWYANVVRPKQALVTAVTRDGTFLIENGEVTRPLADMRLTDGVLGILSRTRALGAEAVLTSDGEFYGRRCATGVVCPALRAEAVRFTG